MGRTIRQKESLGDSKRNRRNVQRESRIIRESSMKAKRKENYQWRK